MTKSLFYSYFIVKAICSVCFITAYTFHHIFGYMLLCCYLLQQGYKHTLAFLQRYVMKHQKNNKIQPPSQRCSTSAPGSDDVDVYDDTDSGNVDAPMFYIDDDEAYEQWLSTVPCDNVTA